MSFGQATSTYYQENVDLNFFNYYLKGKGSLDLPEVLAYCTGSNDWHRFDAWPPTDFDEVSIFSLNWPAASLRESGKRGGGIRRICERPG
ncbi:MAG TPA: hypothetical protein VMO47_13710 [Rhodothermales bacterium]|nr:hypothetical protein [Rhodothermales bacterium]